MATATAFVEVDMDDLQLEIFAVGDEKIVNSTTYAIEFDGERVTISGVGFVYDADGTAIGGTINALRITLLDGQPGFDITGLSVPVTQFVTWLVADDVESLKQTFFAGADTFTGSTFGDVLRSFAGADTVNGGAGSDTLDGGAGDDTVGGGVGNDSIVDASGTNYLRGDEGDDRIVGGSGFDDINGNAGNDTCVSGGGDDWVVGGRDNDSLVGSAGQNLVYGNLGADTCDGGAGNDVVRGGQQNDVLFGGAGDDYVSGDRDNDTVAGGLGADIFHTFAEAGIDRVLDFSLAQGDRVMVDPGTQYTVTQVGADTVIDMTGGGQMILVGVSMTTLTGSWIFGA